MASLWCDHTMVYNDLTGFYNIEMGNKYYMGFPGHEVSYLKISGSRNFISFSRSKYLP